MLHVATQSEQSRSAYTCWMKEEFKQFLNDLLGRLNDIVPSDVKEGQSVATLGKLRRFD